MSEPEWIEVEREPASRAEFWSDPVIASRLRLFLRSGSAPARYYLSETQSYIARRVLRANRRAARWRRLAGFLLLSDIEWRYLCFCVGVATGAVLTILLVAAQRALLERLIP